MKRVALRLAIYQIRKLAAQAARQRQTTFLVIDEAWSFLAGGMGSEFVVDALRSGRKDGLGVILLSQQLEDFAAPDVRAAILGNVSSRLIGHPGKVSLQAFRELLGLTERQVEMIARLRSAADFREFLLVRNDSSEVVRVPSNPLIEKLFSTRPEDMAAWERLRAAYPRMDPLELVQGWAEGRVVVPER
jgi:type IV secretory pathway VirB4 component